MFICTDIPALPGIFEVTRRLPPQLERGPQPDMSASEWLEINVRPKDVRVTFPYD